MTDLIRRVWTHFYELFALALLRLSDIVFPGPGPDVLGERYYGRGRIGCPAPDWPDRDGDLPGQLGSSADQLYGDPFWDDNPQSPQILPFIRFRVTGGSEVPRVGD